MIKIENELVTGFDTAIRAMPAKGYRKTGSGCFEAFISNKGKTKMLGTYKTEEDAKDAVYSYRINRFLDSVHSYGLNEKDCLIVKNNYAVFKTGEIFNLHGKRMIGMIDHCGYKEVNLNGQLYRVHRIVAETFIPNKENKSCVNHIDGNKLNNNVKNLEWATYSENTIHAYKNGLEKPVNGESNHNHKLTAANILYIRGVYKRYSKEFGSAALARKFGVNRTTIASVAKIKTWRCVK